MIMAEKIIVVHEETDEGIKTETRIGLDADAELSQLNIRIDKKEDFVKEVNRKLNKKD